MTETMRTQLESLLDQYDETRRDIEQRKQKAKLDEGQFQERFQELCRSVVRPVFESAGAILKARGHDFSIEEEPFSAGPGAKTVEARITMRVVPAGARVPEQADGHLWSLSFTTRHYNRSVWMNGGATLSAGGAVGSNGAYQLTQIDSALVESQLLTLIGNVIRG